MTWIRPSKEALKAIYIQLMALVNLACERPNWSCALWLIVMIALTVLTMGSNGA